VIAEFYRPGSSLLHRWDPRAKLLTLPILLAAFFLCRQPWTMLALTLATAAAVAILLGVLQLMPPLKTLWPILTLILLLTPPFHAEGKPVVRLLGLVLATDAGLRLTAVLLLRFLGITFGFFAVVRTLALDDMVLALRWFRLPYAGCLVFTITLRTIPTLARSWHSVVEAHRLRIGVSRRRRGLVATYLPVVTSVMIEAVKSIPLLAMALESRGFGRREPRTALAQLPEGRDLLPHAVALAVVGVALLLPSLLPV
jgi:energy-coupling factor transport system permease protein